MLNKRILVLIFLLVFLPLVGCFPQNHAPIITSIPVTDVTEGETYVYDVEATDPDGDTLTYSLTVKPTGMTIDPATGLIKWTPKTEGNYAVVVKVSDGALDIIQSLTIVVIKPSAPPPVNHAPIITSNPNLASLVGIQYTYTIKATDPDGDTLTYSLVSGPEGMTFDTPTISWTPGTTGSYDVTVKVSDGKLSDTQSFIITVSAVKPELTGIEVSPDAMILLKGDSQQLTVTAHYGDGSTADITSDCIYASSDSDIASVGVYGLIMAMGFGKSTIHVSATPDGIVLTDTVEVTVGLVHNVTQDFYRNTIQAAIDDDLTLAGDTIEVSVGMYNLTLPIAVDKALTLTGDTGNPSSVVINAPTTGSDRDCFQVQVSNVTIQGFRMQNSYDWGSVTDGGGENGGVMIGNNSSNTIMFEPGLIIDLSHVTVTHCEFDNCSYGVYVYEAGDNITIDYNVLTSVWRPVIFYGWEDDGTWLQTCDNSISHNTMDGFGYPFYVNRVNYSPDGSAENRGIEFGHAEKLTIDVQGLSITHNEISNYIRHAIILSVSGQFGTFNGAAGNYIDISHNTITYTAVDVTDGQGRHTVEVWGDYVQFSHNTVIDHAWYAFCGLFSHYKVHDNVISNMVPQLDFGHVAAIIVGDDAEVYDNTLTGGITGITLFGNGADVYNNNISDYTSMSSDGKGGNGIFLYSGFATDTNIYSNDISGCLIGIRDEASPAGLVINSNNIYGNANYGVSTILSINAENNWWGSGGIGDDAGKPGVGGNNDVSANVDYDPWSTSEF